MTHSVAGHYSRLNFHRNIRAKPNRNNSKYENRLQRRINEQSRQNKLRAIKDFKCCVKSEPRANEIALQVTLFLRLLQGRS